MEDRSRSHRQRQCQRIKRLLKQLVYVHRLVHLAAVPAGARIAAASASASRSIPRSVRRQPARPAAKSRKTTGCAYPPRTTRSFDGHAPRPQLALLRRVFLRQRQKYRASADGVHQPKQRVHDERDALGRFQKTWSQEYTRIAARLCGLMRVFLWHSPSLS
jgi:hypothetical protein